MLARVLESTKNVHTKSILFAGKMNINKQVSPTLISKLSILPKELFETFLIPEKYPLKEVVTDVKGRLNANIYNGFAETLFSNILETKKGDIAYNMMPESIPKKRQ